MVFSRSSIVGFILPFSYVLSLYLIPISIQKLPRDHPTHIQYRMIAVTVVTLTSIYVMPYFVPFGNLKCPYYEALGLRIDNIFISLLITVVLMGVFYLGVVVSFISYFIQNCNYKLNSSDPLKQRKEKITFIESIREYLLECWEDLRLDPYPALRSLIVAPITEELVFRCLLLPSFLALSLSSNSSSLNSSLTSSPHSSSPPSLSSSYSLWTLSLSSPLCFSLAHLNHLIERARLPGGLTPSSLLSSLLTTLLQLTYTSIFSLLSSILLLRTGNALCPVLSHIICNFVGLPDLSFLRPTGGRLSFLYPYRYLLLLFHLSGLIFFCILILPLTSPLSRQSPYLPFLS